MIYNGNMIHDEILNLLGEFLPSNDSALLVNVKPICMNNLENKFLN